jgi:uncharacterized membrane protein YphA (DoxX/SURF4 family)
MSRGWASGGPRSPVRDKPPHALRDSPPPAPQDADPAALTAPPPGVTAPPPGVTAPQDASPATPQDANPATPLARRQGATTPPIAAPAPGLRAVAERTAVLTAEWAPTAGRILLGVVFAWFGYHELLLPGQWTQYVPVISESSSLAVILVLVHGWVLLVLAAALLAGIAPRAAAAIASVLMLEIVISLAATGLSDTALRDVGVLGLAVCLVGSKNQHLVLRS